MKIKVCSIFFILDFSNQVYDKESAVQLIKVGVPPVGLLSIVFINIYLDEIDRMISVVLPRDWKDFRYQTQVIIVISEQSVKKGTKPMEDEIIKEIT